MQQGVQATQPAPTLAFVSFSAEINPNTTEALIAGISNLANHGVKQVHLLLSTPGGSVMHGITLYNTLRGLPIELTTHNVGNVDSIGAVIFLAGKRRYACAHSTFMFHGVAAGFEAKAMMPERMLIERLESVQADQKRIAAVIKAHTSIDEATVEGFFLKGVTLEAEAAKKNGLVDDIRDVQVPPGCPVLPLVFQR